MTIEEQREVAIKVVVGIFSVLAAGLFIAYIYEQMQSEIDQKKPGIMDSTTPQQDFIVEEISPESAHLHREDHEEKC